MFDSWYVLICVKFIVNISPQVLTGLVGGTVQDKEMEKVIMRAIDEAGNYMKY